MSIVIAIEPRDYGMGNKLTVRSVVDRSQASTDKSVAVNEKREFRSEWTLK